MRGLVLLLLAGFSLATSSYIDETEAACHSLNMECEHFVQCQICLDYKDTVNKLFHKFFTNSTSIVNRSHYSHVRTRANHCRAHPNDIP